MSRITFPPIRPGDTRDAGTVQEFFDDLEALSLTAENAAPEGLWRDSFGLQSAWELVDRLQIEARPASSLAKTGTYTQLQHDGTPLRFTFSPSPLVVGDDEAVRLRAWVHFGSSVSAGLGVVGEVRTRWYVDDDGTVGPVPNSVGGLARIARGTWGYARNNHGVAYSEGVLTDGQLNYAEIRYTYAYSGTAEAYPTRSVLWIERYKRWSV